MKNPIHVSNRARGYSWGFFLLAILPGSLHAETPVAPPALEFSSGLPGKQVRLTWIAEPGLRYRIERSTALGSWSQIALVETANTNGVWLDPEPTVLKAFYRVVQPQAEVFSISSPVLTPDGGELRLHGQRIPAGSSLVLGIEGEFEFSVPLVQDPTESGVWIASISGGALPDGGVLTARVVDSSGATLVLIGQQVTVTATGLALDSPPSLPPAAPMGASRPVPSIGIVVKKGSSSAARMAPGPDEDCDDANPFSPLGMAISEKGLPVEKKIKKTNTPKRPGPGGLDDDCDGFAPPVPLGMAIKTKGTGAAHGFVDDQSSGLMAIWGSKKGYQYYMAKSDLGSAQAQNNPYFTNNGLEGEMVPMPTTGGGSGSATQIGVSPAPSGLPGEVSFRSCDLSLPCPAGPPLEWVCTYRSMVPISSGHGPGWDFSYNIRIDAANSNAPRVTVHDGGGRADIFLRQADGSYRCDGMFREGRFVGETFTLTFADKGTWTFKPLDGAPEAGKISEITDRNGVGLACAYDGAGQIETVTDAFGRRLTVEWGNSPPRVLSVTASDGVSLNFSKIEFTYSPQGGKRETVSAPFEPGRAPVAGPTSYAYASSAADPRLDDNLLSITDGAGRLMEEFTYSGGARSDIDFDTCATHNRNKVGHVTLNRREIRPPGSSPASAYTIFEVDEIGRLTETDFDRLHRVVACREFTGFCTPNVPVTSSSNRPTGKLRDSDPDFFETTCTYNADSLCTRITHPDGSQELATYDRDFRQNCPVRERANPRVISLTTPGPVIESRAVTMDYQPGFGTPELFLPGNPIKGMTVKGGRNPGGDIVNSVARKGWDGSVKGKNIKTDSGGGGFNAGAVAYRKVGLRPGAIASIVVAAVCSAGEDEDCDGACDDDDESARIGPKQKAWLCSNFRTRIVNAHGQVSSFGYDSNGNRTSYTSALPNRGNLYQYDGMGRCISSTVLNGTDSSFIDDFAYGADGFLSSATSDSAGLHLTTSFGRDAQGRITSVTDPRGSEWLYAYNPLHQCTQIQSPLMASGTSGTPPHRITTDLTIDAGGRIVRCDTTHFDSNGSLDSANPAFSTFFVRDERARLVRVAGEERPVDGSSTLDPSSLGIENFAVCDFTYDNAGQLVRLSTPAVCRDQSSDLACAFSYDERGLLHRCIEGDTGDPAAIGTVTTVCDYDSLGALVRCATQGAGVPSPATLFSYDGFHRLSSTTDPMGNMVEYAYGNDGSVTTSVFGELNDQPGSAGNVLLARATGRRSFGSMGGSSMDPVCLELPGVSDVCYGLAVKGSAFFSVETEDDTLTVERFTPGSTAPPVNEVTFIDRSPAGLVQLITCNGDLLMSCEYDTAGRRIRCADGSCSVVATLDACGDVVAVVRTDISGVNGVASKTFSSACVRDPLGRMTSCTDGSGNTSAIAYDSLGRPVSFSVPGRPPLLYAYDGGKGTAAFSMQVSCDVSSTGSPEVLSSVLSRAGECRSITDANGYAEFLTRDSLGRVISCAYPDGTTDATTFDSLGRPIQQRSKDQSQANHTFDLNGRLVLTTWAGAPPVAASNPLSVQYDGLGRQVRCEQGSSVLVMTYDSCGNPTGESENGRLVSRTFNHRGRTATTYPNGVQFNESRDALGQLLAITNSTGGNVVTMGYAGHRAVRSVQGNGVVTTWAYRGDTDVAQGDFSFDECVRSTVSSPSSVVLSDERVFRDRSQQVTRCETRFAASADAPYRSKAFTLDGLGRITACVTERRETSGGPVVAESSVSYTLDLRGRRLSEQRNGVVGSYAQSDLLPPGDFQMGQYTTWPGSSLPLEWDDNGNLSVMTRGTTQLDFVHNDQGQLVAVNDISTAGTSLPLVIYTYDALGRRTSRTSSTGGSSVSTTFVYDGGVCIQELGTDGLADLTFVSSGGIQHCISTRNGTLYYPHGGAASSPEIRWKAPELNSNSDGVVLMTSATGAAVERFDRDEACKPVFLTSDGLPSGATSSSTSLRWLSPACAWEPEIGMFACPGGVYSPDLGRSVSTTRKLEYRGHVTVLK